MTPTPRIYLFLLSGILFTLCTSCEDNRVFEESKEIEDGIWRADNIAAFSAVITDTISLYDMYLDVRNDINYPFSNLYLFLKTTFPGGQVTRDTIECILAGYDGKWLGSGAGSIRSNRFLFQQGMRFPMEGTYLFELEQAMRVSELEGIRDVGICIDKK